MRQALSMAFIFSILAFVSVYSAEAPPAAAMKPVLKKGQRVAVVGDSITEQKQYSKNIELYLTACLPELELHVIQLGWGGETAPGFQQRMNNDLMPYKPEVVTTNYGMNDGGYGPFNQGTGQRYNAALTDIVTRLKKAGAIVIVGSPGAVDSKTFRGGGEAAKVYNATLSKLGEIAQKIAESNEMPFANVHDPMMAAMEKAKAVLGEKYDVCGGDGVHPNANGHLVMAYAYLKAMGVDGSIGTITVDMKGAATATDGHKVLSAADGKVELESTKYPFCFFGDEKSPGGTRSILPYVPFNQELNRFLLIVKNLDGDKAKVTWGNESKSFSRQDLESGINLADQFINNPFSEPFRKLDGLIAAKQNYETPMIKEVIHNFGVAERLLGEKEGEESALEPLRKKLYDKYEKLHEAVRAGMVPVKHTLTIAVEK